MDGPDSPNGVAMIQSRPHPKEPRTIYFKDHFLQMVSPVDSQTGNSLQGTRQLHRSDVDEVNCGATILGCKTAINIMSTWPGPWRPCASWKTGDL